jgi:hypothetical protein
MFWRDAKTDRRDAGSTNGGGYYFGRIATNMALLRSAGPLANDVSESRSLTVLVRVRRYGNMTFKWVGVGRRRDVSRHLDVGIRT